MAVPETGTRNPRTVFHGALMAADLAVFGLIAAVVLVFVSPASLTIAALAAVVTAPVIAVAAGFKLLQR